MEDNLTDEAGEVTTDESPNVRQMRERMEAQKEELAALREEKRTNVFEKAGLPLDKGIGKAVATLLPGHDVTVEQVQKVAREEFDWNPDQPKTTAPAQSAPAASMDSRLDQITAGSTPVASEPPNPQEDWARRRDEHMRRAIEIGVGNEGEILQAINAELRLHGIREVIPNE